MAMEEIQKKMKDDVLDIAPFDLTKTKKENKIVVQDPADDSVDALTEKTENLSVSDKIETASFGLKKKKKPVQTSILDDEKENVGGDLDDHTLEEEQGDVIVLQQEQRLPWEGADRDYEYDELLGRVADLLLENNPELAGDRRRIVLRPPEVLREGTKKTIFTNFMGLCRTLPRVRVDHYMAFMLAELGTSGSLDADQRLVVKGRFTPKYFEGIQRKFVNQYVVCDACRSPDTILSTEDRIFFLICETCGSRRSVAPIKAGYQARVGGR
ncbi:hypothetical protein LguiA_013901 [Lonicera macranthoides]